MTFGKRLRVTLFLVLLLSPAAFSQEFTCFGGFRNVQLTMIRMPSTLQPVQLKSTPQLQIGDAEQASTLIKEADQIISLLLEEIDALKAENDQLKGYTAKLEAENAELRSLVNEADKLMTNQTDNRNDWMTLYQGEVKRYKVSKTLNYILGGALILFGGLYTFNSLAK